LSCLDDGLTVVPMAEAHDGLLASL
jgi:hypothetical protein